MIIDVHTHCGRTEILSGSLEKLVQSMKVSGVDKSFVFAGVMGDCSTDFLLNQIAPYQGSLYAVASLSPYQKNNDFLFSPDVFEQWLAAGRVYGLKLYVGYEHFYPSDSFLKPYIDLLVQYKRPLIFHSGDLYNKVSSAKLKYAHPLHIDDLASDVPDVKIIIAHVGYPWVLDAAQVCSKNENVFTDCSGFVYGSFTAQDVEAFRYLWTVFSRYAPAEKFLFGTDWPISDQASYVSAIKEVIPDSFHELVFYKNTSRVFGL